jgi:hypothetical protein
MDSGGNLRCSAAAERSIADQSQISSASAAVFQLCNPSFVCCRWAALVAAMRWRLASRPAGERFQHCEHSGAVRVERTSRPR